MGAHSVSLLALASLLLQPTLAFDSASSTSLHRGTAEDDYRAFVPYDALVHIKRTSTLKASPVDAAVRHAHFARRAARTSLNDHNPLRSRQVHNPRQAAKRWEHRGAKRATASNVPSPSTCKNTGAAYAQCGGIGFTGDTCCVLGYTCTYSNDYYSQCIPSATTCSNAFSGQCGGSGWTGSTCCPAGSACIASSAYYSQCIPGATSDVAWSSSTSTTTQAQTSSSSTTVTTTVAPTTTTTKTTSTSTTTSAAAVPTCSGSVSAWGQCGGTGWTGSTCCGTGYVCTYSNAWYSQCLAGTSTTSSSSSSSSSKMVTSTTSVATTTQSAPAVTTSVPAIAVPNCSGSVGAYGQCGGLIWLGATCCTSGYTCQASSIYYSQCLPGTVSSSSTSSSSSSSTSASKTSTSSAPSSTATSSAICIIGGGGSDGCTPYSVTAAGVTLPLGTTYVDGGHVNYQAIPCSQYTLGETYRKPGADWTPQGFGVHFESLNNQPSGVYIGKSNYPFSLAAAAYPSGFCVTWVQVDIYNQHWGEGGQPPICSTNCLF